MFGIASVINHISEITAYFYSVKIIGKIGHVKVMALGLLCNIARFVYVSLITWPWFILPMEFVQGITHAAVWAAMCSFISHNTTPELRPSAQGFLQGMHTGFGKFCGAVFGGILIKEHGKRFSNVFAAFFLPKKITLKAPCWSSKSTESSGAVFFVLFVLVNFYNRNEGGMSADLPDEIDPKTLADEGCRLAPTGVPSSHMPRALSSSKLDQQQEYDQQQQYGKGATNNCWTLN